MKEKLEEMNEERGSVEQEIVEMGNHTNVLEMGVVLAVWTFQELWNMLQVVWRSCRAEEKKQEMIFSRTTQVMMIVAWDFLGQEQKKDVKWVLLQDRKHLAVVWLEVLVLVRLKMTRNAGLAGAHCNKDLGEQTEMWNRERNS